MNDFEKKILANIEKHGCHVTHVFDPEGLTPDFTYSVGIQQCTGQPEVIITGLEKDMAHFMVNEYNSRIKDGERFEADQFYDEFLEGFQVTFKEVDKKHYEEYFVSGLWLYKGNNFRALHMIWPSMDGIWPWEKKASKDYRWFLPRLYKS